MKCNDFRDLIFLYQDGALPQPEMAEFAEHLHSCPACAGELRAMEKAGALLAERPAVVPAADWQHCWQAIAVAVDPWPRPRKNWFAFPRWALVTAGFLAFFILGIAFARLAFSPARARVAGTSEPVFASTAQDYFSLLQPVMAEYGNAREAGAPAPEHAELVRRLLNDLYLLKLRAENSRDEGLRLLLGDIELVLIEMAHLDRSRPEDVRRLSGLIQDKGLAMKLMVFKPTNRKITQI
jgi:hypothetical protein